MGLSVLILFSLYVQPVEGDLTRIGGYSERNYGWNLPQEVLNPNFSTERTYDKYYDIVILGDSFSISGIWQAYFTAHTDLSYTTLSWDNATVKDILNNPNFINTPPKLFVVESGVRYLSLRFYSKAQTCPASNSSRFSTEWLTKSGEHDNLFIKRSRDTSIDLTKINLKFALHYIENSLFRLIFNNDFSKVKKYALTRNDLFSNIISSDILLLQTWSSKNNLTPDKLSAAICEVSNVQNLVQNNGKTIFVFMPIPEKGSAYLNYILEPEFTALNVDQELINNNVNTPKLEMLIKKAIDGGEKDLYLPNDTHFGYKGYQLTATALYQLLRDLGVAIKYN